MPPVLCILNEQIMRTQTGQTDSHFSSILLTGTILLANVDVNGLVDYGLKAVLGGAIWLGYKVVADYMEKKRHRNSK
jgi:hypothetical protein